MNESDPPRPSGSAPRRPSEPPREALQRFGINAAFVEEIRHRYEVDPSSVDASWGELFEAPRPEPRPVRPPAQRPAPEADRPTAAVERHARALRLIHSYRARGHRIADVDPLGGRSSEFAELDPVHHGFAPEDLDAPCLAGDLPGEPVRPLRDILDQLRATYCRHVGIEYTHIQDTGRRTWLQQQVEATRNTTRLDASERLRILEKLSAAELFERFIHTRFIGQKRFSLEGAESLIPLLDTLVERAPGHGVREFVLGMAHRGRLNVLSNILGKSLESVFGEFEDVATLDSPFGSGDVKYHKGYSADRRTRDGARVHLSLTSNPSHLEAVDPVVEGRAKAKQTRLGDEEGKTIVPVLIHGDTAFAGQGIVTETLNLCNLIGYSTGGTIHVVVNNQIGFTTTPSEARSTLYCTDVAKMIQIPIFHVNGDDPEAVVHCAELAFAWRQRFGQDVLIDLVCYRRHGHNEGDEPSYTQPLMYARIRAKPSVRKLYTEKLLELGLLTPDDVKRIEADLRDQLRQALEVIQTNPPRPEEPYAPHGPWTGFSRHQPEDDPDTCVPVERLAQIAERLGSVPSGFAVHPKLAPLLDRRRKVIAEGAPVDWATAEALAFGSLVLEGTPVRLSGQDTSRGTFSQRHAILVDQVTEQEYAPLDNLSPTQARFHVFDSTLSEAGVLGFEYGYSLADPSTLTLWEAQFGDFANGAQVIIDQFIAAAHVKWQRMSGLVMLLPHGYEGQGPEHSSARIERFLQLCAEDGLQCVNCTTPAQYFHVLRRQMLRPFRAPLVIFTPKSLLRLPRATSSVDDFTRGRFGTILDDAEATARPSQVRRVLLCSGKVYYDLLEHQDRLRADTGGDDAGSDVAIVRMEQLYPWPEAELRRVLHHYESARDVVWVQEEPANMGAWAFVRARIRGLLPAAARLGYAGRADRSSPATGSMRVHRQEQQALVEAALGGSA